jgi:Ca2+-binding EF-hand superfamily protein
MTESKTQAWIEEHEVKIRDAFDLFDTDKANALMQEDCGNVMRALGIFPSEAQLMKEYLPVLRDDDNGGYVTYKKFEREVLRILATKECEPSNADTMMQAFRTIDTGNTGVISAELLEELLVTKGTAFRPKEVEDFLDAAKDSETGNIYYEDYVSLLYK